MRDLLQQLKTINRSNWREVIIQFIKFGMVGVSNTLVSTTIYYLFLWLGGSYLLGNAVGWIVSVLNSFFWNNRFVFRNSAAQWWQKLIRTYVAYGGSFIIGSLLLVLQVRVIGVSEWLAPWINMVVTVPLNFILNKFWAFRA